MQENSEISANFASFFVILGDIVSNLRAKNTVRVVSANLLFNLYPGTGSRGISEPEPLLANWGRADSLDTLFSTLLNQ